MKKIKYICKKIQLQKLIFFNGLNEKKDVNLGEAKYLFAQGNNVQNQPSNAENSLIEFGSSIS